MRHFIPFVLALAPLVVAVDRNNFKTCKDSSFCDRRRKFEGEGEKYKGMSSNTIICCRISKKFWCTKNWDYLRVGSPSTKIHETIKCHRT